jgi:hypothetical protein
MKLNGLDALMEDWIEGLLSEPDATLLCVPLKQSPETRVRYGETVSTHGLLEHAFEETSWRAMTGQSLPVTSARPRIRHWGPFAVAVAGLGSGSRPQQCSTTPQIPRPAASRREKSTWQAFAALPASTLFQSILIPTERIEQAQRSGGIKPMAARLWWTD